MASAREVGCQRRSRAVSCFLTLPGFEARTDVSLSSLVQPLAAGPVDIVADVHGFLEPLKALLTHLGYRSDGWHPEGRRLVFLGDLTDRGPNDAGVVAFVTELFDAGLVQGVLGNHDLNILLEDRKPDNRWYFADTLADSARTATRQLFRRLPLALVRPDLRIVHACWDDSSVEQAAKESDVVDFYHRSRAGLIARLDQEGMSDPVDREEVHQNDNPVKLLTSGPERRGEPFADGNGVIRHLHRVAWWQRYTGPVCVVGHYGLARQRDEQAARLRGPALVIDYGIGKGRLAAFRYPESRLVLHDGETTRVQ